MDISFRFAITALLLASVGAVASWRAKKRALGYTPRLDRMPWNAFAPGPPARLTAFYFTSRLCAECQETPGIVREAAPGLPIVAIAVHERPDLARALGVSETPTLLLVDAAGRIRYARAGNPTASQLRMYVREAEDSVAADLASVMPTIKPMRARG